MPIKVAISKESQENPDFGDMYRALQSWGLDPDRPEYKHVLKQTIAEMVND